MDHHSYQTKEQKPPRRLKVGDTITLPENGQLVTRRVERFCHGFPVLSEPMTEAEIQQWDRSHNQ